MIPRDPDDQEVLAGEYVLGLLGEAEMLEVEARLRDERDLAAAVARWQTRFLPATRLVSPEPPDPELWARLERSTRARPAIPFPDRVRSALRHAWSSAPVWRGATALASAVALAILVMPRPDATATPSYFAILQSRDAAGQDTGPGWLLQVAQDGTLRSVPLGRVDPGGGRALQLWTLWDRARGPVSLGVLPPGGAIRLPADRLPVIGGDQLFEITLEPEAGSPTGRPSGQVLFIGRASAAVTRHL